MALLFADGFEEGFSGWTFQGSPTNGAGRYGNGMISTSGATQLTLGFTTTAGPMIAGLAFKPTAGTGTIFGFGYTTGPVLYRGSSGEIIAYKGNTSGVIGTSAANVLPAGAWSYIEMKATFATATTGILVVRVNGVEVINLTAIASSGVTTQNMLHLGGNSNVVCAVGAVWDDFYMCDGTGSYNNDFLGDIKVEHMRPGSDDTAQWMGSDANSVNNWDLVNEAGAPVTTDYVTASTVGLRDLYVPVPSAAAGTVPVYGVLVTAVAQKTDVSASNVKLLVKEGSGGTVRQSSAIGLPTSFGELRAIFERKADGTQFTVADANALRMGIEVVA